MSVLKTTLLLSSKMKPSWSRYLILLSKDRLRSYSTYKERDKIPNRTTLAFLACALVSGSALSYTFFKLKENKFPSLRNFLGSFIPTISATTINLTDISQNRNKYNFIADVVEICSPAVVFIENRDSRRIDLFTGKPVFYSNGSGFIVDADGLILTSAHVVMRNRNSMLIVRLWDGTTYNGVVEDIDLHTDLATVRINKKSLPVMKLGNSKNLRTGEFVVAIGSPLSLSNSITSGVISSAHRPSEELGMYGTRMGYIQTDATITFGNSGGPLVNLDGEAIGINAMQLTPGISFAVPINTAKDFLKKAEGKRKKENEPQKRYLGIEMLTLTDQILSDLQHHAEDISLSVKHGVWIWKVIYGSPAHIGGLKVGDIITHVNSEAVLSATDIYKVLQKAGSMNLTVVRNGQVTHLKIEPENLI